MCGIALLWDEPTPRIARARMAEAMGEAIRHRGPDGQGLWSSADVPLSFSHRRLAIQGLGEQGAQPMIHPAGHVLLYNGELFGAAELRATLIKQGVAFHGTSDTEILLHALALWGMQRTLARVHGQFAFAFYDAKARKLFLGRDRVGIRPLYYATERGRLAAGSEQKALLLLPWVDRRPRPEALLRYLALGRTDDVPGETMLAGVHMLPAGHWAEYSGQDLTLHRYYRARVDVPASTITAVRRRLILAVGEQLVGDVPLGATVSGGLDSSSVALLADRARLAAGASTKLHLFAYHDALAEQDERQYQHAVLSAMQSPHEVHWVSSSPDELAQGFERYIHHQEEPYADISSYAEHAIAREAAKVGVKVLLSGLGGDEVFLGYPTFIGPLVLDLLARGSLHPVIDLLRVTPQLGVKGRLDPLFGAAYHALPARLRNALAAARAAGTQAHLPRPLRAQAARDAFERWHVHDGKGAANAALRGALESWCIPRYLAHSDRMGLAAGVEGRVPLLDEGVIQAAWGVPLAERVGPSGLKATLRAAASSVLPPEVRDRAWKLGFHAPLGAYVARLDEPLREGHRVAGETLGASPSWDDLAPAARWQWGNLGAYLAWVRARPALLALDPAEASLNVASAGLA
ncbi:MAG: asparagine synthase (glutamine-hydrolyzing) [Byssovorax sp.]